MFNQRQSGIIPPDIGIRPPASTGAGNPDKSTSARRLVVKGPVSEGEPAIEERHSQELTPDGVMSVTTIYVPACSTCGRVLDSQGLIFARCSCGGAICQDCAASYRWRCSKCHRIACAKCGHWGLFTWYCNDC
jgi:hypothetical protein